MPDFDRDRFQDAFVRVRTQSDRLRFEKRHELVDDLAIILEVVYGAFVQLDAFNRTLTQIAKGIQTMAGELDTLKAQVASSISVQEGAIQLIVGIKSALDAAIAAHNDGDPTALAELSATLGAEQAKLAAAITANTPVAPVPVPVPPDAPPPGPAPGGSGGGQPNPNPTALQAAQANGDTLVSETDTQITYQSAAGQTTYDKATGAVASTTGPTPTPTPTPAPSVSGSPPSNTPSDAPVASKT